MRAKCINEKFIENSDPIHDMGIGLAYEYKEWCKKYYVTPMSLESFEKVIKKLNYNFVEFLINAGIDVNGKYELSGSKANWTKGAPIRFAISTNDKKMIQMLLDAGADPEYSLIGNWLTSNSINKDIIKFIQDEISKYNRLKESVNEKFLEDSDPIHDMGIGLAYEYKEWCKKYHEEFMSLESFVKAIRKLRYDFVEFLINAGIDIHGVHDNLVDNDEMGWEVGTPIRFAISTNDKKMIQILLDAGADPNHSMIGAWLINSRYKKDIVEFIQDEISKYNKLKESMNEKFTEDSDLIKDMGIGKTIEDDWEDLAPGDIFQLKGDVFIGSSCPHPKESFIKILSVYNKQSEKRQIKYYFYKTKENLLKDKKSLIDDAEYDYWNIGFEFFKDTFEKVYIENLKESVSKSKFYPKLFEAKTNTLDRKFIIDELIRNFPDKYESHTDTRRIKNIAKVPIEEFITDITNIANDNSINIAAIEVVNPNESGPYPELLKKRSEFSGRYQSVVFIIDEKPDVIIFTGTSAGATTSKTSTLLKEGMVLYFFQTDLKYTPFTKKDTESNYIKFINRITKDIEENGIKGLDDADIKSILSSIKVESTGHSPILLETLCNSMSVAYKLLETEFSDWVPYRDAFFNKIKSDAASNLKYAKREIDKWCTMDFILIKPGVDTKQQILDTWESAKNKDSEQLKLGEYNSIFVNDLDNPEDKLILAVSLKQETHQLGWGKSFFKSIEDVKDNYCLTNSEMSMPNDIFLEKIVEERKKTLAHMANMADKDIYSYELTGGAEGFKNEGTARVKYASLKLLNYILTQATQKHANIFIDLATHTMGLGKNPPFFTFIGDNIGDPNSVKITPHKQLGGITSSGKIHMVDNNTSPAIKILFSIEEDGQIKNLMGWIRPPNKNVSDNVNFSIMPTKS